jgi:hypothetical protein
MAACARQRNWRSGYGWRSCKHGIGRSDDRCVARAVSLEQREPHLQFPHVGELLQRVDLFHRRVGSQRSGIRFFDIRLRHAVSRSRDRQGNRIRADGGRAAQLHQGCFGGGRRLELRARKPLQRRRTRRASRWHRLLSRRRRSRRRCLVQRRPAPLQQRTGRQQRLLRGAARTRSQRRPEARPCQRPARSDHGPAARRSQLE